MKPTIGRIVHYKPSAERVDALHELGCNHPEIMPAVIVAVWSDECVNLKVLVDGPAADMWVTSANRGDETGQWNWPKIVPENDQSTAAQSESSTPENPPPVVP